MKVLAAVLAALVPAATQADRDRVAGIAGPSVVRLRNEDGHGSGMVLDEKGLILTNGHVVCSPLPYAIEVDHPGDRGRPAVFRQVSLVGFHPRYDLALVRLDPREHDVPLRAIRIAPRPAAAGDPVFAVGFPITQGGAKKTTTAGRLTSADRPWKSLGYYASSVEIWPGNSGGPLCDREGQALGVNTMVINDGKVVGLAIPLHDLRPDLFVPIHGRGKDPGAAAELLRAGDTFVDLGRRGNPAALHLAKEIYHHAIPYDFGNPDPYFKLGMLYRNTDNSSRAIPYLLRSLQMGPWPESRGDCYHELGVALASQRRAAEARVAWQEGLLKYPRECGAIWDDLAVYWHNEGNLLEAAYASQVALKIGCPRGDVMNQVYRKAREELEPGQAAELRERQQAIESRLNEMQADADRARRENRQFMTRDFEALLATVPGLQKEARGTDFAALGSGPAVPVPPIPEDELTARFIQAKIIVAREHWAGGKRERAIAILEDVVKSFARAPATEEARRLLGEWKR